MYLGQRNWIYSPSDLCTYMQSPFASWMDRYAKQCPQKDAPVEDTADALNVVLQKRGYQHEEDLISELQNQGKTVFTVADKLSKEEKAKETLAAMTRGEEVIFQAFLELTPFKGYADFLVKVPGESNLGDFHYEVWDTKLSRQVKPKFLVQLCCYAEMLESIQGVRPQDMAIVLGNQEQATFRVDDYFYYYQSLKHAFLTSQAEFDPDNEPDPALSKNHGHWADYAHEILVERDHLSQVATMTRTQIKKFNKAGITTMTQLAQCADSSVSGVDNSVFNRLRAQASIQKATLKKQELSDSKIPCYEILVPEPQEKKGLALLPPHSDQDVFFDIEGFPLDEGGLEYLWGNSFFKEPTKPGERGERDFIDFWAHDSVQEKQSFGDFIQWVYARWQKDSQMHVYHYANYEIAAIRKLMGRYGVCEFEVDELLRNEVFVDLYKLVKSGLLLGEPRYSIKNVEHLYRGKRQTEVGNGGDSVVVYDNWRTLNKEGEEGDTWKTSKILKDIRDYNIDDCDSTQELVDWLRVRQEEHGIAYIGKTEVVETQLKEEVTARTNLRDNMLAKADAQGLDSQAGHLTQNLAWSLEFHRREEKPVFWKLFDRLGMSDLDLVDDLDCLALCERTERKPFKIKRSQGYEYSFNEDQDFKGSGESFYVLGAEDEDGKRIKANMVKDESDLKNGLIVFKSTKDNLPPVMTLVPDELVSAQTIAAALSEVVQSYHLGTLGDCAIVDFLKRSPPKIKGHARGPIIQPGQDALQQLIQAVLNLDGSYLTIQGPPGAGKTYSGKHIIGAAIKDGLKVGISSNSHKAINNLLLSTAQYCEEQEIPGHFVCTRDTGPELEECGIKIVTNSGLAKEVQPSCVLGTTAWGFVRDDMEDQLDYLFIDEAGQVSVANLIAMSRCAKNIVIMGDQMQLGQPTQGTHPAESGLSILDYLLKDNPTIPDDMGVFLGTTYRMHSAVNEFISGAVYEGKLHSDPDNDKQVITVSASASLITKEAGIISMPVEHSGNTQSSDEEIEKIVTATKQLLTCQFTNKKGETKPVTFAQILYVAPYNHQVSKLKVALESLPGGKHAKVGSVDKFQGQEAPVVFYSLCASDPAESPRGLDFLYDIHRLNVAISRAQSLAIVVGHPDLKTVEPSKVRQMKMVNVMARLLDESVQNDENGLPDYLSVASQGQHEQSPWESALNEVDESVKDWLGQFVNEGIKIPSVYFELDDDSGMVIAEAELAWPAMKLVLLTHEQKSVSESEFIALGWRIIDTTTSVDDVKKLLRE